MQKVCTAGTLAAIGAITGAVAGGYFAPLIIDAVNNYIPYLHIGSREVFFSTDQREASTRLVLGGSSAYALGYLFHYSGCKIDKCCEYFRNRNERQKENEKINAERKRKEGLLKRLEEESQNAPAQPAKPPKFNIRPTGS